MASTEFAASALLNPHDFTGMQAKKPTWRTIMDSCHGVHLATIERSGKVIQVALKGLSELRRQILTLLQVPITFYRRLCDGW